MEQADLSLVRLVAARYEELQGLGRVVDAVVLLWLWSLLRVAPVSRSPVLFGGVMIVWAGVALWSANRVARYYRERFGRTAGAKPPGSTFAAPQLSTQAIWMTMVFGGFFVPLLAVYAGYVAWRDRPYRTHWLLIACTGAVFTLAFFGLDAPAQFEAWQSRFVWTAAPVVALVGLLDDRLLRRAMKAAAESTETGEHADTI